MSFCFFFRRIATTAGRGIALALVYGSAAYSAPVDVYLPKSGVMKARLMVFAGAPEDEKISEKFKAAVTKDQAWFMAYVKAHNNEGGELPYDPRFGITKDEYHHMAHAKLQLKEVGQIAVTIKTDAKGAKVLEVPPDAKALSGFAISSDGKSAVTPAGTLLATEDIHNNDPDSPTGRWEGISFGTAGDPSHGKPAVELAFGKRGKEGDGLMYYKLSATSQGQAREIVLLYPLD